MIRAFIALELQKELLDRLVGLLGQLRLLNLDGRIARPGSIHLTLKFLGEIRSDRVPAIQQALKNSVQGLEPFALQIGGLGTFPTLRRPRVLWIGVEECESFRRLKPELEAELEALGFPVDGGAFRPHLTLMRLKSSRNVDRLSRLVQSDPEPATLGVLDVDSVHLYQSILRPRGAEYSKLVSVRIPTALERG